MGILTIRNKQIGSIICSSFFGIILGLSISPNLWLIGSIIGGWYGQTIVKQQQHQLENDDVINSSSSFPLSNIILASGASLSKAYLKCVDSYQTIFFMYKTGQLS